ncbi:unnamed protein product [Ranitomeya imitator]|uniref:HORMA domain-containing protein n=1 Tax=Ranitomeya imitator TaxID=111125 RepID=A0ABN9LCW0_9NEOB|nr:unnamed protein product [Ranitomeya imitator]
MHHIHTGAAPREDYKSQTHTSTISGNRLRSPAALGPVGAWEKEAGLRRVGGGAGVVTSSLWWQTYCVSFWRWPSIEKSYPIGIFQKRKKYNVPVQMSGHPELNRYIQDTLHCVKPLIEKNDVEKVVLVILDKEHHPVERFVFEIAQPPLLSISSDSLLTHVEQLLRAFILKISVCDAVLDNNPPGCTFTLLVHTREAATRNMEKIQVIKDFPWILADEQDVHMQEPRLIPLKTMTSDILKDTDLRAMYSSGLRQPLIDPKGHVDKLHMMRSAAEYSAEGYLPLIIVFLEPLESGRIS